MTHFNSDQLSVMQAIQDMRANDRLLVTGRAGSGKTYAIANSVSGRNALFLTPTHPARVVLDREIPGTRRKVMTIHSAIGWFQVRDDELNPVDRYIPAKEARKRSTVLNPNLFEAADIIIVDECSMVGSFLFGAIEEYAKEYDLPVVYSGDLCQLPPVGDREVLPDQNFPTIALNQSVRFPADSETFKFGEMLRHMIEHDPDGEIPLFADKGTVRVVAGEEWLTSLADDYAASNNLLAVTSLNKRLKLLREKIRQVGHDRLATGDLVISKQTDELFRNGEQFTVSRIEPETQEVPMPDDNGGLPNPMTVRGCRVSFLETSREAFILVDEKEADKLAKTIRDLFEVGDLSHKDATKALDWIDQINRFELAALATIHKSQGRTVDTVYIDTRTVAKRPSRLSPVNHKRLLYTAITRARHEVIFYQMKDVCTCTPSQAISDSQQSLVAA